MLKMRDISNWQGTPDITKLNGDIMAIKATEGTGYTSPAFAKDWHNTRAAHKARMAYHFLHPSLSPIAQARYFIDTITGVGLMSGDLIAVDHEVTDGLPKEKVAAAALEFVHAVNKEIKCQCIVYTFLSFAEHGNCAGLGKSPLWIADPSSPAAKPRVPHPWESWAFHQYGITRGIDDDIANYATLDQLLKLGTLVEDPQPAGVNRVVWISDGETETERLVSLDSMKAGFMLKAGKAVFRILERQNPEK